MSRAALVVGTDRETPHLARVGACPRVDERRAPGRARGGLGSAESFALRSLANTGALAGERLVGPYVAKERALLMRKIQIVRVRSQVGQQARRGAGQAQIDMLAGAIDHGQQARRHAFLTIARARSRQPLRRQA